jgi:hypothetical protein
VYGVLAALPAAAATPSDVARRNAAAAAGGATSPSPPPILIDLTAHLAAHLAALAVDLPSRLLSRHPGTDKIKMKKSIIFWCIKPACVLNSCSQHHFVQRPRNFHREFPDSICEKPVVENQPQRTWRGRALRRE